MSAPRSNKLSNSFEDNKEARQSYWKDPNLFQSFRHSLLRLSSNRVNKAEIDCLKLGNTIIGGLTSGTILIGDVPVQAWQSIQYFYLNGKKTKDCSDRFSDLLGFNVSAYSLFKDQYSISSDHYPGKTVASISIAVQAWGGNFCTLASAYASPRFDK